MLCPINVNSNKNLQCTLLVIASILLSSKKTVKVKHSTGLEIKSTPVGFRAGMHFLYETESSIHIALGRVTFHAKRGA